MRLRDPRPKVQHCRSFLSDQVISRLVLGFGKHGAAAAMESNQGGASAKAGKPGGGLE